MVIKSDDFDQVRVILVIVLKVLPNDLLKSIDNKLFFKGWIGFLSVRKLLVCLLLVFGPLHVEKCK